MTQKTQSGVFLLGNCTQFIEACVPNDVFRVKNGGSLLGSHLYALGGVGYFLRPCRD